MEDNINIRMVTSGYAKFDLHTIVSKECMNRKFSELLPELITKYEAESDCPERDRIIDNLKEIYNREDLDIYISYVNDNYDFKRLYVSNALPEYKHIFENARLVDFEDIIVDADPLPEIRLIYES